MSLLNRVADSIRRHFLSGVLVVVPIILTYLVLKFLFEAVDGILQPLLTNVLGYYRTGLGVLTTILLILLAGLLTRNFIGHKLYSIGESLLVRVPIIRPVYSAAKQLLETLAGPSGESFKEVVLIEYPRRGTWALCFVTRRVTLVLDGRSQEFTNCFVPSTPTPISGFVILVPTADTRPVDLTVEQGVQFLVSGGVASPALIRQKPPSPPTAGPEFPHTEGVLREAR